MSHDGPFRAVRPPWLLMCLVLQLVGLLLWAGRAQGGETPSPEQIIERMSRALLTLNYEGQFVHVRNGHVEAMHIVHANDGRGELERMMSLTGEAREVIRNHSRVTCIFPRSQSVLVTRSKPRNALPNIDASMLDNPQYEISGGGTDRVAGFTTHVVNLVPRDAMRYGYRFWVDTDTSMLLRSMLLDNAGRSLEEVMFIAIEYPETIPAARFDIELRDDQISWIEPLAKSADGLDTRERHAAGKNVGADASAGIDRVQFDSLPPGYDEISESYRAMPINDGPISHVMLSDGVASVSVYVEFVDSKSQSQGALGPSSMGAMSAFGLSLPNALVTAVGEVPAATVRQIAAAVRVDAEPQ